MIASALLLRSTLKTTDAALKLGFQTGKQLTKFGTAVALSPLNLTNNIIKAGMSLGYSIGKGVGNALTNRARELTMENLEAVQLALSNRSFTGVTNYIYLHHIDKFILIPVYPDNVSDTLSSTFKSETPLARSAPIFAYESSGPRTVKINLDLHRDLMYDTNVGVSNVELDVGDDYIDTLIKEMQAMALPKYASASKLVNPPMVSLRLGNEIYIKGIVNGAVSVNYKLPILDNDKYAQVSISFDVTEVDPYDATVVAEKGSFRGLDTTLDRRFYSN